MFFFCFFIRLYLVLFWFFLSRLMGGGLVIDYFLFSLGSLDFSLGLIFDCVSLGFFCRVSFISGLVFFYSVFYMEGTIDYRRFV